MFLLTELLFFAKYILTAYIQIKKEQRADLFLSVKQLLLINDGSFFQFFWKRGSIHLEFLGCASREHSPMLTESTTYL